MPQSDPFDPDDVMEALWAVVKLIQVAIFVINLIDRVKLMEEVTRFRDAMHDLVGHFEHPIS